MKPLIFLGSLLLCGCTMKMPNYMKVQNLVERYLDSINMPDKVKISKFSELITIDNNYLKHQNPANYRSYPDYKKMSDSEKVALANSVDTLMSHMKGYEIFCTYSVKNVTRETLFKIDTTITKVSVKFSKSLTN